jgi:hypothetical protein
MIETTLYRGCLGIVLLLIASGAAALSDPTRPSGAAFSAGANAGSADWRLTATRITPDLRSATINGIDVAEGASLGAARVLRISHAQVQLELEGRQVILNLLPAEVKTIR